MEPHEIPSEMAPWRIFAPLRLKVRPIACTASTSLRKAWMRKNDNRHTVWHEDPAKRSHGRVEIGCVHQHVVRNGQIEACGFDGCQCRTAIHAELDPLAAAALASHLYHPFGQIDARDNRSTVAKLARQIPGATARVEHALAGDIACKVPEHRIGTQNPIQVSIDANVFLPIFGKRIPNLADLRLFSQHSETQPPTRCATAIALRNRVQSISLATVQSAPRMNCFGAPFTTRLISASTSCGVPLAITP